MNNIERAIRKIGTQKFRSACIRLSNRNASLNDFILYLKVFSSAEVPKPKQSDVSHVIAHKAFIRGQIMTFRSILSVIQNVKTKRKLKDG